MSQTTEPEIRVDQAALMRLLGASSNFAQINSTSTESFQNPHGSEIQVEQLISLYEQDNFIANLVDHLPERATSKWCHFDMKAELWDGQGAQKKNPIQQTLDDAKDAICTAWKLARLRGWAIVYIHLVGAGEPQEAVREQSIKGIAGFTALAGGPAGEVTIQSYDENKLSLTYGMPLTYSVDGQIIHHSRVLLFTGIKRLSRDQISRNGINHEPGISVIYRSRQAHRNFIAASNAVATKLLNFNQAILKIKDLAQILAKEEDAKSYFQGMSLAKTILNMIVLDADGGDYGMLNTPFTGVHELLEYFKKIFAGSTDLMASELFNESPAGVTSGRFENEYEARYVAAQQESVLTPLLYRIIRYGCAANNYPLDCGELSFPPLYKMDDAQLAKVKLTQAQVIKLLIDARVLTPEEAADALSQGIDIEDAIKLKSPESLSHLETTPP